MLERCCKLEEVDEIIAESEDFVDGSYDIMEKGENYEIVINHWWVHIPELGLDLYEGMFCNWSGDEGVYEPDFSITVIKQAGQEEWLYWEQDGFGVSLANYLNHVGNRMDLDKIGSLPCCIKKNV